jgi:tetratricopeptide (TPR) repeat protein
MLLSRSRFSLRASRLAVAVLAMVAGSASAQPDPNKPHDYYAFQRSSLVTNVEQFHLGPCQQRLRERDYARSVGECNFILKIFPNHPRALVLTTEACNSWKSPLCRLDEVFQNAVSINPQAPETFVIQGMYQHRSQQYGKAIRSYEYALQLDPNLLNAHYNLALTYLETKQFDLANEHAQRAYALGATLPGLRKMLESSGHWTPIAQPDSHSVPASPKASELDLPHAATSGAK